MMGFAPLNPSYRAFWPFRRTPMHDLRWIRENPDAFDRGLLRRSLPARAEEVLAIDREWRALETQAQESQATRNRLSREIGAAKSRGEPIDELLHQVEGRKRAEAATAAKAAELRRQIDDLVATLPNLPAPEVPDGPDESANKELRRHGKPPRFNFDPLPHETIGEKLGLMDFGRAARLSGSRFVVLKGALARLERAVAHFMLDLHTGEFGYTEISPPLLVRDDALFGTCRSRSRSCAAPAPYSVRSIRISSASPSAGRMAASVSRVRSDEEHSTMAGRTSEVARWAANSSAARRPRGARGLSASGRPGSSQLDLAWRSNQTRFTVVSV